MGLGSSVYKLTFDSNALQVLTPTRRELAAAKAIMLETRTAAEKYGDSLDHLNQLLNKDLITVKDYNRAVASLRSELPANVEAAKAAEAEQRRLNAEMARADEIIRRNLTPLEKYEQAIRDLPPVLKTTEAGQQALRRETARLRAEYERTIPVYQATLVQQKGLFGQLGSIGRFAGPLAALTGISVGVGSIGLAARRGIGGYSEFQTNFTRSTAIMGDLTEDTLERMRQTARDVSFDVEASAADAAKGFFYLASAGLTAEESIGALPVTAKFAQAGAFDLALATDLLTDAQSALGLNVGDTAEKMQNMRRVSDVLTKANVLANASIEQFSTSLTNKAGAALKVVNKDIEEGVAVLAAFADQGIKGEEAGTAFAIIMRDLQTQAIANKQAFIDNSVAVFDAAGNMNNMADIIRDLESRLTGLSDEAKKKVLIDLGFSDKSVSFTQALIGTSEKIAEYEAKLRDAQGMTDEVAGKSMPAMTRTLNTLKAGFDEFSGIVLPALGEGFMSADGRPLEESIRDINEAVKELTPLLVEAGRSVGDIAANVGSVTESIQPLIGSIAKANDMLRSLSGRGFASELFDFGLQSLNPFQGLLDTIDAVRGKSVDAPTVSADQAIDTQKQVAEAVSATGDAMQTASEKAAALNDILSDKQAKEEAKKTQQDLAKSVDDLIDSLQFQIDTLGMSADEAERYRLAQEGVLDVDLELIRQQQELLAIKQSAHDEEKRMREEAEKAREDAAKAEADRIQKQQDDIADYIAELEKEIATRGMSADQVKLWELAQQGVDETIRNQIEALQLQAHATEELTRARQASFGPELQGERSTLEGLAAARDQAMYDAFGGATTVSMPSPTSTFTVTPPAPTAPARQPNDLADVANKQLAELKKITKNTAAPAVEVDEVTL